MSDTYSAADVSQTNADLLIMAEKLDTVLDAVSPPPSS